MGTRHPNPLGWSLSFSLYHLTFPRITRNLSAHCNFNCLMEISHSLLQHDDFCMELARVQVQVELQAHSPRRETHPELYTGRPKLVLTQIDIYYHMYIHHRVGLQPCPPLLMPLWEKHVMPAAHSKEWGARMRPLQSPPSTAYLRAAPRSSPSRTAQLRQLSSVSSASPAQLHSHIHPCLQHLVGPVSEGFPSPLGCCTAGGSPSCTFCFNATHFITAFHICPFRSAKSPQPTAVSLRSYQPVLRNTSLSQIRRSDLHQSLLNLVNSNVYLL